MNQTNEQQSFDYAAEAHLTASPHFYGDRVPLAHFAAVLQDAIDALSALDRIKKALFYGRDLGPLALGVRDVSQNCAKLPEWISDVPEEDEAARNIIHGIIGKATEAGELLELLHATAVKGEVFDVANAGKHKSATAFGTTRFWPALVGLPSTASSEPILRSFAIASRTLLPNTTRTTAICSANVVFWKKAKKFRRNA